MAIKNRILSISSEQKRDDDGKFAEMNGGGGGGSDNKPAKPKKKISQEQTDRLVDDIMKIVRNNPNSGKGLGPDKTERLRKKLRTLKDGGLKALPPMSSVPKWVKNMYKKPEMYTDSND